MRVRSRTTVLFVAVALAGTLAAAAPVSAAPASALNRTSTIFPTTFALPDGFQPEGIAIGALPYAFFGSRATGAIYRVSLLTGRGEVINPGSGPSLGLKVDPRGRLFVAGGNRSTGGAARVLNAFTGEVLASYQFSTVPSFVNDVVLTPDAAWFTDSTNPVLYKLPLDRWGGLPDAGEVVTLPLTGDIVYGAGVVNANGIETTPDGRGLLIVQSATGLLFRVDPDTGVTRKVDLGGELLTNGDGLLREGRTLYVVQNRLNTVAVFELDRAGTSARLVEKVTSAGFDVPTTVAAYGNRLYLPNARFTTPITPPPSYAVTAIPRP